MSVQIRPISADQVESFQRSMALAFGIDPTSEHLQRFNNVFERDRLRAIFDRDQIVATFGALSLRMTVPGNVVPVAGTSVVTVLPTHRRQGLLREMMKGHMAELRKTGEPLAALWASESSIYGRFGYGPAVERAVTRLEKSYARFETPADIRGTMRLLERDEAQQIFPAVYDRVSPRRPGMIARTQNWWTHRVLGDPEFMRRGATAHRRALYVRDGRPEGYVIYRSRTDWDQGATEVRVIELVGTDPEAEKALWQYVFGIDLVATITHWNQPPDDPLRWWLEQPRRLDRKIEDALWVRPIDVGRALSERRYAAAGSLRLRIHDTLCPWNDGVWKLEADAKGQAVCRQAEADAEIALSPATLGMLYLGGHRASALAKSGLVTGSPEALARADALFTWDPLPWCPEIF